LNLTYSNIPELMMISIRFATQSKDLSEDHTQIIVIVKFGEKIDEQGQVEPNNFVITAYMK